MKVIIALLLSFICVSAFAKDTYVRGYARKNGTYVPAHHRTSTDSSKLNNYSTRGNTNPYTGKPGTVDPYSTSRSRYDSNNSNSNYSSDKEDNN